MRPITAFITAVAVLALAGCSTRTENPAYLHSELDERVNEQARMVVAHGDRLLTLRRTADSEGAQQTLAAIAAGMVEEARNVDYLLEVYGGSNKSGSFIIDRTTMADLQRLQSELRSQRPAPVDGPTTETDPSARAVAPTSAPRAGRVYKDIDMSKGSSSKKSGKKKSSKSATSTATAPKANTSTTGGPEKTTTSTDAWNTNQASTPSSTPTPAPTTTRPFQTTDPLFPPDKPTPAPANP